MPTNTIGTLTTTTRQHSDAAAAAKKKKLVIQFAHGLESGPHGRKYQILKKQGHCVVVAPNMRPLIRAAHWRAAWRFFFVAVLLWNVTKVTTTTTTLPAAGIRLILLLVTAAAAAVWSVVASARELLQQCVGLHAPCMQQHAPNVLLGSSL